MKASRFNILLQPEATESLILFNSLYGSLSIWEGEERGSLLQALSADEADDGSIAEIRSFLVEQQYLVDPAADELGIVTRRKEAGVNDENRLDVVLMPTLECNFACPYCYESPRPGRMTSKTEEKVKAFLSREIPKSRFLMLLWFGGEPLICLDRLVSLSVHAREECRRAEVEYSASVTTNGYLLDERAAQLLVDNGILDYQITFDGPKETHDKMRFLRSGRGTFDRIFENVVRLCRSDSRLSVSLRVNFNDVNYTSVPKLLDAFPTDIRSQLRVTFEPVFGACSVSAHENLSTVEISTTMVESFRIAQELGYDISVAGSFVRPGRLVYCFAERRRQFLINYNADVFKCSVGNFERSSRLGFISEDGEFVRDGDAFDRWVGGQAFEKDCCSCSFLPLCMGGCRKMRLAGQGTGSNCEVLPVCVSSLIEGVALERIGVEFD